MGKYIYVDINGEFKLWEHLIDMRTVRNMRTENTLYRNGTRYTLLDHWIDVRKMRVLGTLNRCTKLEICARWKHSIDS